MVGWHHRLNGHEFEQTPGVPRVHQESNPEIPVPPGDEHDVLDTSLDKVSFALQ